ncbi:MAG: hypothetical protein KDE27_23155 [Planctomycetes bacterium]|nr:hypothetical protein [Planctomycetota bacterium]
MRNAHLLKAFVALLAFVPAGCSNGSADSSTLSVRCAGGGSFCLVSCDLGCSQTGCSITEIAENQRLRFTFNDRLATGSVNGSSVSIRTSTGVAPEGDLMVTGNQLTFVPRVRTVNGISTFGFQRNESYIITIAGGAAAPYGVKSASGDTLSKEFSCTVVASRGIVDQDQQPPTVQLVSPTVTVDAPRDPTIVLRFSELIDTTPLRGTLTPSSPIRFTLRTATEVNGALICNRDSAGVTLEGIPRLGTETVGETPVTVVEFKPTVLLPGLSCLEVVVTADLRDLSGRQAIANRFEFFTEAGTIIPIEIVEGFASPANLDDKVSSGSWSAGAKPGVIGGDGRHGSFDIAIGSPVSSTEFTWDTTSVTIPAANTPSRQEMVVTDGKFYFTDMTVPAGYTVNFVGPVPPQIRVRGKVDISGTIRLNGVAMEPFDSRGGTINDTPYIDGQPGGEGGAGGGSGGRGGNECRGAGPIIVNGEVLTNGANGEDVRLLAGHAYITQSVGTGGRGSAMNPPTGPASGEYDPNPQRVGFLYRAPFSPGGGGGGFQTDGSIALLTNTLTNLIWGSGTNPEPAGGILFDPLPLPTSNAKDLSLNHFTIGGSGGGGGASHSFSTRWVSGDHYCAGSGGSGGGGACAIRAGSDLVIQAAARCEAMGGDGALINGRNPATSASNPDFGISSPGGGGSGGSFLFQSGRNLTVTGIIDTSGGPGSRNASVTAANLGPFSSQAGAGSPGFYRCEAAGNLTFNSATTCIPVYAPARHMGPLNDEDDLVGQTSLWYGTNQVFPPTWLSYELDVDTDGDGTVDVTYTDSGAAGTQVANDPNGPVHIQFQGGKLAQATNLPIESSFGEWRDFVGAGVGIGIGNDGATAFRFNLTFNRAMFPDCVIVALRVHARA